MHSASRTSLTAYQRDIWAAASYLPDSTQFQGILSERLTGPVDVTLLAECVTRAAMRTDAYRLLFDEEDGVPFQWVDPGTPEVTIVDLSGDPDPAAAVTAWLDTAATRPFTLRRSALAEFFLVRESDTVTHLCIRIHHLVSDLWALSQFTGQVLADYARVQDGGAPADFTAPQYLDFVKEEARYRASADFEQDRDFFRTTLGDATPALFTRKEASGSRGDARHSLVLEKAFADRIREAGLTPFSYLSAVFGVYLSRVHRTGEVTLGVPFLNRHGDTEMRTIGQFANTLPLRVPTGGQRTLREIAAGVHATTRALRAHDRLALGDLLRALPGSAEGPRRLFDVAISYLRYPRPDSPAGLTRETELRVFPHDDDALAVGIREFEDTGEIRVDLDHALDVFDEDFPITAVAGHLQTLLRGGLDRLDQPVDDLPMLDAAEFEDLVHTRNATKAPYAHDKTLHQLFEERVARAPEQVAVVADTPDGAIETLTYAELDARANQVAHALRAAGVGLGDRVAVVLERGPHTLAAILGTLKAGGAYVPVTPDYPDERIRYMLADSEAKAVLVGAEPPAAATGTDAPAIAVHTLGDLPTTPVESLATARDLAYVIYTSGSTGRPKGVMVEHHSVVNRLAWMQKKYPVGQGDTLLHKTPMSFDVSVWELFWWAIEGARVALLTPGGEKDPREILRAIAAHRVGVLHFVPSMFEAFLELLESSPGLCADAASLRFVFCSGEALPADQANRFARLFGHLGEAAPRLVNLYGPTEATVDVSGHDLPGDPARPVHRVPIGRPIDNIRLYVLGSGDAPQPVGVPGELCIAGVGLARGYLGRPELTEEKFVADPFTEGERMYRTGDLVRWLAGGELEYLGRIDEQVKIRGHRIELGEVRARLAGAPGVRQAAVVDQRPEGRAGYLVGYYVADRELDPAPLRAHLAETLPEFMIPAYFMRLESIPLTPNGKTDRRALPLPQVAAGSGEAPRDATEAALAEVWAEQLGADSVGVHDNYFALGGDSIVMLRVRAAAERRGLFFSLADLVRNPTVAALAAQVSTAPVESGPAPAPFELVPLTDRGRLAGAVDAFPVTRLQLAMLYHGREHEDSARYHDVFRYSLDVAWDQDAFEAAFAALVARHPVLRSSFDLAGHSVPLQIIHAEADGGLEIADLRRLAESAAEERIAAHIEERRRHRYRFDTAPLFLFRAHVLAGSVELVFSFHHAILDGWSVATLIRELLQDYAHGLGLDIGPVSPEQPPSLALYAREEQRALAAEASAEFWRERLEGAKLTQPDGFRQYEPPAAGSEGVVVHHAELPPELGEQVRRLARERSVPVKAVLLAAHVLTLRLLTGTEDVTTGLVTHGRPEREDAERTAGLFLNTVPLRVDAASADATATGAGSWLSTVREVYREERSVHPHRRYPLAAIQEAVGGRTVLRTAFNYVHFHVLTALGQVPGITLRSFRTWEETDLGLLVNAMTDPHDARIGLRIDGDARTYTPGQLDLFAATFAALLTRIVERPEEPVDFAFLADQPANSPAGREAPVPDVVRAFADQAAITPDAVALSFGEERWTYAELDQAAERIARRLLALGTPAGARIGIAMDRSPEMIAVVLGIARAGAGCLPLDVGYPKERLAAMLETSRPFRVVAHARHAQLVGDPALLLDAEALTGGEGEEWDGPLPAIEPDGVAYVLFTSGSTGRPKGVTMPHRALANLVAWQNSVPSGDFAGRTLQFAPLSFDVSFQEIFATLSRGGTLCLVAEEVRRDMPQLLRLLDAERVERVFLPYVALQQLASASDALGLVPRALRVLVSSGEQLRVTEEIRRLCAALPGVLLENQYGPTESHVVTSFPMTGDPAAFPLLPPIGKPVTGARVRVLDAGLRPLPPGAVGELYLGGDCLALGYENAPELTAERFAPDPADPDGGRLYRTGDLAMVLPDGSIACVGRADNQVKVRGFRVEPAEVELALMDLDQLRPAIREAAVVARKRDGGDSFLAAFLVGEEEAVDLGEVRKLLRQVLPDHLVPSHFGWLPELPLTPSGKRDDAALRAMPLAAATAPADRTPPRDHYESSLVEMLAEVLQQPGIGPHDDFFDLGGTSITAMRLVVTVEQRYGVSIPMSAFIATPTAAGLAERLRSGGAVAAFDPLVPIRPAGSRTPLFFVHPMGGNVLCYLPLARHLPDDQPFYALQAIGGEPGSEPLRSVGALAESYLAAIKRVQPHGPYRIGGWSFGGFVAFEMARRLRAAGEQVGDLILLDSVALNPEHTATADDDSLLNWFFWELLWLGQGSQEPQADADPSATDSAAPAYSSVESGGPVDALTEQAATQAEKLEIVAERAAASGILPAGASQAAVGRLFDIFKANWHSVIDFRPEVVDLDLTLLHATEPLPKVLEPMHGAAGTMHRDPSNGWAARTSGRVRIVDVPGDHLQVMQEPYVEFVARAIAELSGEGHTA